MPFDVRFLPRIADIASHWLDVGSETMFDSPFLLKQRQSLLQLAIRAAVLTPLQTNQTLKEALNISSSKIHATVLQILFQLKSITLKSEFFQSLANEISTHQNQDQVIAADRFAQVVQLALPLLERTDFILSVLKALPQSPLVVTVATHLTGSKNQ